MNTLAYSQIMAGRRHALLCLIHKEEIPTDCAITITTSLTDLKLLSIVRKGAESMPLSLNLGNPQYLYVCVNRS